MDPAWWKILAEGSTVATVATALAVTIAALIRVKAKRDEDVERTAPSRSRELREASGGVEQEEPPPPPNITLMLREAPPFETTQVQAYYSQVLSQSRITFWFSLIFASLGFAVIVAAVWQYTSAGVGAAVVQGASGAVIEAVSALFFVQSKSAQKSMAEFFDKLRRDRQAFEARKLLGEITDDKARDSLRVNLCLHFAEVPNANEIVREILGVLHGNRLPGTHGQQESA
jgi:hypothetical protein